MKTKTILLSLLSLVLLSCGNDYSDYDPEAMARAKESVDMCYNIFTDWQKTDSCYIKSTGPNAKGDTVEIVLYRLSIQKDTDTLMIQSADWQMYYDTITTEWVAEIHGDKQVIAQICHGHIDIHDDYYNDRKVGLFDCPKSRPLINPSSDPSIQAGINYLHGEGIRTEKLTYNETNYVIDPSSIDVSQLKDEESVVSAYEALKKSDLSLGYDGENTKYKMLKAHQYTYMKGDNANIQSAPTP